MSDLEMSELVKTLEDGSVSVAFTISDGTNTLKDAIVLPASVYAEWAQKDIDEEKMRRWDEWLAVVAPPEE